MPNEPPLTYPEMLLAERKQQLERLDETQSNYNTCRRSLEQAIQELAAIVRDGQ
jgi:N-acetylglutamate synthase/N-acetylornithine aminotransferase